MFNRMSTSGVVEVFDLVKEPPLAGVYGEIKRISRGLAWFHEWGLRLMEYTDGPGVNFSVAIVEFEDGSVDTVPAQLVEFREHPNQKLESEMDRDKCTSGDWQ